MEAPASRRTAIAFFEHGADIAAVVEKLQALGPRVVLGTHLVEEEPWVERQDQGRGPLRIGRRFLVLPRASTGSIDGSPALDPHPDPVDLLPASHARGAADRRHRHDAPGVRAGTHAAQGHRAEGAAGGARAADERIVLVVPARRAFGTGEHATTRGCLELLEDVPVEGRAVLDLGTGSGILAMAAARLGAGTVVGLDEDPEAIAIARDNLALNGLEGFPDAPPAAAARAAAVPGDPGPSETRARDRSCLGGVQLLVGQLACIEGRFDLILANIDAAVLESLAEPLARLQAAGGDVILSGFSPADATVLTGVFGGFGYREIRRFEEGEWAALRLGRSGGMAPRAAREGM